ncbi:MAG: hypothetical protein ACFFBD_08750, partial [Candidatus Hodarchaeota archaeon]
LEQKLLITEKLRTIETAIKDFETLYKTQQSELENLRMRTKYSSPVEIPQKEIDRINSQIGELDQQIPNLQTQVVSVEEETKILESKYEEIQMEITKLKNSEISGDEGELETLNKAFLTLKQEIQDLDQDIKDKNYSIRELENYKALMSEKLKEKQQKIQTIRSLADKLLFFEHAKKEGFIWEDTAIELYNEANNHWIQAKDAHKQLKSKDFIIQGFKAFEKAINAYYVALKEETNFEEIRLQDQFELLSISYKVPLKWRQMTEIETLVERIERGVDVLPERRFLDQVYQLFQENMSLLRVRGRKETGLPPSDENQVSKKCYFCRNQLEEIDRECPFCGFDPPKCAICEENIFSGDIVRKCPICTARFHKNHLLNWLSTKTEAKCPNCGSKVVSNQFLAE